MDFEISKNTVTCPGCTADFDSGIHTPFIGSCSHSVCSVCANEKSVTICPVCHNPGGFLWKQENELAKELLSILTDEAIEKCPNCVEGFDCDIHIPMIGSCGHRLCFTCVNEKKIKSCLICNKSGSFLGKQKAIDRDLLVSLAEEKVKKSTVTACPGCSEDFDLEMHAPFIGSCGHTLCSVCANNRKIKACPVCSTRRSFTWKRKNELATEQLAILAEKKVKKPRLVVETPDDVVPPILDVNNIRFLARILNELDPSSFVKLARTCATMHSLCFNTKGVKIPYDVFWLSVSTSFGYRGGSQSSVDFALIELEREFDEEADYLHEPRDYAGYSFGYLGSVENREKLRNSPFVIRLQNLEISVSEEDDFIKARSFLDEFPIESISEVKIDDAPPWKRFIQLLKDFNTRHVTILDSGIGRNLHDTSFSSSEGDELSAMDIAAEYLAKNTDSFRSDMHFVEFDFAGATVQRLHLTNAAVDDDLFQILIKRFANSNEEIHWTLGLQLYEHSSLHLYKSLPLDYDGPLPKERPLVFGEITQPFRFWILRKDGKRLRCFGDKKQIVLSTPMFYN